MTDHLSSGDPLLTGLFDAATARAEAPLPGEAAALAAFRAEHTPVRRNRRPGSLLAAAAFGGVVMVGGVAAAATGSMPLLGSHRDRLVVPRLVTTSATHAATASTPGAAPGARRADSIPTMAPGPAADHGKGGVIAPLAHENDPKGEHGGVVCPVASDGACNADHSAEPKPSHTAKTHPSNDPSGKAVGRSATRKPHPTHSPEPESTPKGHPTRPISHG